MLMKAVLRPAITIFVVLTLITGVLYPLAVTLAAQVIFPAQANGSLVERDGVVIGSSLIGQGTDDPRYFASRPSAVNYMLGSSPDAPGSSGASNLAYGSAALADAVAERAAAIREANNLPADAAIPPDLLFASGSGLDPHISPEAATLQVARVAGARGLDAATVQALVDNHTEYPQLSLLGEPRVNVLLLNLALDGLESP
jgi:potassium-transporting ATPase KdpC subunit